MSLLDLLCGYCDPQTRAVSERPIGQTGLTARVYSIHCTQVTFHSLRRWRCYLLGVRHFNDVFTPFIFNLKFYWMAEILRVMDRARTLGNENLTIRLFHERFQADPNVSVEAKANEAALFDALCARYDEDDFTKFRNRLMFHTDLQTATERPARSGDLPAITSLIVNWYTHVATVVYGAEPNYVTVGAVQSGRRTAKAFRSMMMSALKHERRKNPS